MASKEPDYESPEIGFFGPGLITGASDDDPSGIATYSLVGAQFGFSISWTMLFSYPLMAAIQEISARIGRVTGRGIAGNIQAYYPAWQLYIIVGLLFLANTINIGADLGAMGDALGLLIGGSQLLYVGLMGSLCVVLQIFIHYHRYASLLKWLTLSLFTYFGTVLTVQIPWQEVAQGFFLPTFPATTAFWTSIVAILGTTISPYLFFWQASQEVEEIEIRPERNPLKNAPHQANGALERIRLDTYIGMAFSNLVAVAIIITAAATLHVRGVTEIQTSVQAAEALRPVAGQLAFTVFTLGIVGTGLLAVPVLAGSAAYAIGEALKWPVGLARKPFQAKAFYATLTLATIVGITLNLMGFDPIRALFWSAVINGVVAVPVMVYMMLLTAKMSVMGQFPVRGALRIVGWFSTAVMIIAVVGMLIMAII